MNGGGFFQLTYPDNGAARAQAPGPACQHGSCRSVRRRRGGDWYSLDVVKVEGEESGVRRVFLALLGHLVRLANFPCSLRTTHFGGPLMTELNYSPFRWQTKPLSNLKRQRFTSLCGAMCWH